MANKKLGVVLSLDGKKYTTSLKRVQDKTKKSTSAMSKAFNSINFKKLAIGVTAFGAAAVAAATKVIKMAAEQEQIFRTLRTQIELQGMAWEDAKPKVDAFAESLQRTTKYGDTDTAKVLQQLLLYTKDLDQAMLGTKLSMDLAATGLFDVSTASRMVGMAFSGNIEAMGRYIAEFKTSINPMLKTMTTAEKVAFAIDTLTKKVGGASEKEMKTFNAQVLRMKNYIGDWLEAMGDPMLDAVTKVVAKMSDWVIVNDKLVQIKMREWGQGVVDVFIAMKGPISWVVKQLTDIASLFEFIDTFKTTMHTIRSSKDPSKRGFQGFGGGDTRRGAGASGGFSTPSSPGKRLDSVARDDRLAAGYGIRAKTPVAIPPQPKSSYFAGGLSSTGRSGPSLQGAPFDPYAAAVNPQIQNQAAANRSNLNLSTMKETANATANVWKDASQSIQFSFFNAFDAMENRALTFKNVLTSISFDLIQAFEGIAINALMESEAVNGLFGGDK